MLEGISVKVLLQYSCIIPPIQARSCTMALINMHWVSDLRFNPLSGLCIIYLFILFTCILHGV